MKKLLLPLVALMVAGGCNNNSDTPTYDTIVLDFESLSNAIDSTQYGGSLLYGGSGYSWYDETTNLGSTLPNFWGDNTFFGGGIAISNYFYTPEKINYELQLTITTAPVSGNNFAICYVATNEGAPSVEFRNGCGTIESLYVLPTAYVNDVVMNGNDFSPAMPANGYIRITATGIDSNGNTTGVAEHFLYDGRKSNGWTKWNLSSLGEVQRIEFRMYEGTTEGGKRVDSKADYPTYPSYFAIDDIAIRK